jgi:hypothetical protein
VQALYPARIESFSFLLMLPLGTWVKANDLVSEYMDRATEIEPVTSVLGHPNGTLAKNESGLEDRVCLFSQ